MRSGTLFWVRVSTVDVYARIHSHTPVEHFRLRQGWVFLWIQVKDVRLIFRGSELPNWRPMTVFFENPVKRLLWAVRGGSAQASIRPFARSQTFRSKELLRILEEVSFQLQPTSLQYLLQRDQLVVCNFYNEGARVPSTETWLYSSHVIGFSCMVFVESAVVTEW